MKETQWDSRKWEQEPRDKEVPDRSEEKSPEICDSCGINPSLEQHRCKYAMKVLNNYEFHCNCCEDCKLKCAESV